MFSFEVASKTFQYLIKYGYGKSVFGKAFIGFEGHSIYHLHFFESEDPVHIRELQNRFPSAVLEEATSEETAEVVNKIFMDPDGATTFRLMLQGTDFQTQVWQQLCMVPRGCTWTYEHLAQVMGKPKAIRAVANAVARNEIAYLVPCHRIVAKNKSVKYRWGSHVKTLILTLEEIKFTWSRSFDFVFLANAGCAICVVVDDIQNFVTTLQVKFGLDLLAK